MTKSYKPAGYSTVSPYLVVKDAFETLRFLTEVFDAEELRRFPAEDGGLIHAELCLDDTVIMLADSNDDFPAVQSHVHIYVQDVDAAYQRALEAGGQSIKEPSQQAGEDDRRAGVMDSGGTSWWIATRMS